jgi:glutamate--cysteine ligase
LSEAQDSLAVSYNDLASYTASLDDALTKSYPPYEAIGIREGRVAGDGVDSYRQLASSLLQIENEFYSTIRPKRVIRPGERPLHALRERGVEYVEVRAMDLDPFSPIGIAPGTIRFLNVFLLHCLLYDSPADTPREIEAVGRNKQLVASRGRESGLRLDRYGETVSLSEWGAQLLAECGPIARALDEAHGAVHEKAAHRDALASAVSALDNSDSLPSARMLREMSERYDNSYARFALARSLEHRRALKSEPLPAEVEARFTRLAEKSIRVQREIEAADKVPFETFRQRYLSHESLRI